MLSDRENDVMAQVVPVAIGWAFDPFLLASQLTDASRNWGSYENQVYLLLMLIKSVDEKMEDESFSHMLRAKLG